VEVDQLHSSRFQNDFILIIHFTRTSPLRKERAPTDIFTTRPAMPPPDYFAAMRRARQLQSAEFWRIMGALARIPRRLLEKWAARRRWRRALASLLALDDFGYAELGLQPPRVLSGLSRRRRMQPPPANANFPPVAQAVARALRGLSERGRAPAETAAEPAALHYVHTRARALLMTPRQIALVRENFAAVKPIADTAAALFYDRLFALDPALRALFKSDMRAQGAKLMQMIGVAVAGLHAPEALVPTLEELGRRHRGYGVEDRHYATVGEALIWTLEEGLGAAFTAEARAAWLAAYMLLAGVMQAGAARPDAAAA
jgi:hemoglobin-like flavoprotein